MFPLLQAGMLPFKESFHTFPILKELSFRLRGTVFEFAQAHPPWRAPDTAWREFRNLLEYYQVQRTSIKKAEEEKVRLAAEDAKREADRAEKVAAKREADRLKRQTKNKAKKGKVRFSILDLSSRFYHHVLIPSFSRLSSPRPSLSRIQRKKTFLTRTRVRPGTFSIPPLPLTRYFYPEFNWILEKLITLQMEVDDVPVDAPAVLKFGSLPANLNFSKTKAVLMPDRGPEGTSSKKVRPRTMFKCPRTNSSSS
jgi:hypothetical protein